MFYLIESENIGPNKKDGIGSVMSICTKRGTTNMSREVRTEGWLGTSGDVSCTAHGEFGTLDEARDMASELGFTEAHDFDADTMEEDGVVEQYVSEADAREQWDSEEWLNGTHEGKITAETTDEELNVLVAETETEAREQNVELSGCGKLFYKLRDELKAEAVVVA